MQTNNCFMYCHKLLIDVPHGFSKCWYFNKYCCSHLLQVNLCEICILWCCMKLFCFFPRSLQVSCQLLILVHKILNVWSHYTCKGQVGFRNGIWILLVVHRYHPLSNKCRWCVIIWKILSLCLYNLLLELIKWHMVHIHYQIIIKRNNIPFLAWGWICCSRWWRLNGDLWCTWHHINIFNLWLLFHPHVYNFNQVLKLLSKQGNIQIWPIWRISNLK